jgi:hypothetical protein
LKSKEKSSFFENKKWKNRPFFIFRPKRVFFLTVQISAVCRGKPRERLSGKKTDVVSAATPTTS